MNRNLTATILIILAIAIYFTVTAGILADASAVKTINDQYSSAIQSALQLIKVRDDVLKSYNNLKADDRARLDKMVPHSVDNIRLVIDLNSVALRHGFSLKNITAKTSDIPAPAQTPAAPAVPGSVSTALTTIPVIPEPVLGTVKVSFSVTAPYQEFISMMQDLEANLRIMDVTNLKLTSNDNGKYDWDVTLQTYWLKNQ